MNLKQQKTKDICESLTDYFIIFMITAYPLFTGANGYVYLHFKKYILFVLVTSLWALSIITLTIYQSICDRRLLRLDVPEVLVLLFMLSATVSTFISDHGRFFSLSTERYDGLLTYLLYGVLFLGVCRFGKVRRKYIYLFSFAYSINCIISIFQLIGYNALWLYPNDMNYYSSYVQEMGAFLGTLGNIDVASAMHCIALPLFGIYILLSEDKSKYWLAISFFLGIICLIASKVVSGILSFTIILFIFLPIILGYKKKIRFCCIGFIIIAIMLLAFFILPNVGGIIGEIQSIIHGEFRPEFGSHRFLIWQRTLNVIRQYPLLGVGPDCLDVYINIVFERYSEVLGDIKYSIVDNAHNEYLQLLASFGIIGTFPIISAFIYIIADFFKSEKTVGALSIFGAIVCYAIQAFFNIGQCIVLPTLFIGFGLLYKAVEQ